MRQVALVEYLDRFLGVPQHPDYPTALNGLQVEGTRDVSRICAAVDASDVAIEAAVAADAHLLIVHHGLFWEGLRPLTGRRRRKVARLIQGDLGLYSAHLPLDGHPEVGNCILLAQALGIEPNGRFASFQGHNVGWWGEFDADLSELIDRAQTILDGPVRVLGNGPARVERIGVVTGSGASFLEEAAQLGLDTLVTGEGAHHTAIDAAELGMNLVLGGHYATETFGVRALAEHLGERFGLEQHFLDVPTGT